MTHALQPTGTNLAKRILVVDDEPDIRSLHIEVLTDSGYHVDAAEDGAIAWDALRLQNYDLLITDDEMPKVTGVELLEKLHAAQIAVPVIMVSGTMPTEKLKRPELHLVKATLDKPYAIADLLYKVNYILEASKSSPAKLTAQVR